MEKIYYSISEVCEMLDIKPHTIRYWETEFIQLKAKTKKGYSRRYSTKDIELLKIIKELIYDRKFTLEGAMVEVKKLSNPKIEPTIEIKKEKPSYNKIDDIKRQLIDVKMMLLTRNKV